MTVDPRLLEQARRAGARAGAAEQEARAARADYHAAVRRIHLAGAPLREIAKALSLSHQRVQQMVSASGGSWWQIWRRRADARVLSCSWCHRPSSDVANLIAGPKVFICDVCVEAAERAAGGKRDARRGMHLAPPGSRERCDFCRKRAGDGRSVVTGPPNVCTDCLRICREILEGRPA